MKSQCHLKQGMKVKVIAGAHKGQSGELSEVITSKNRVKIIGVNVRKVFLKPSKDNPKGGVSEKEFSIHASNVSAI